MSYPRFIYSTFLEKETNNNSSSVPDALELSFQEVNSEFLRKAQENDYPDGCSALVLYIRNNIIYVANVGDSMGYIGYNEAAVPISKIVSERGFGSLYHKETHKLSVSPDIMEFTIHSGLKFIIMGTWTFWNNLEVTEAVELICKNISEKSSDPNWIQTTCLELVTRANSKSPKENISCILLIFRHKEEVFS